MKPRFFSQPMIITKCLIVINVFVYLLMTLAGGSQNLFVLVKFGAKVNSLIAAGQIWRLFTPMFLHIGLEHLVLNMVTLYFIGAQIERMFGAKLYLLIYLSSGICGNLASFAFNSSISAGSSTAIFGIFGSFLMLVEYLRNNVYLRHLGKNFIIFIILNVVFSFASNVDLSGHLGGLLAGFLLAYAFGPKTLEIPKRRRIIAIIAIIIIYGLMWNIGLKNI